MSYTEILQLTSWTNLIGLLGTTLVLGAICGGVFGLLFSMVRMRPGSHLTWLSIKHTVLSLSVCVGLTTAGLFFYYICMPLLEEPAMRKKGNILHEAHLAMLLELNYEGKYTVTSEELETLRLMSDKQEEGLNYRFIFERMVWDVSEDGSYQSRHSCVWVLDIWLKHQGSGVDGLIKHTKTVSEMSTEQLTKLGLGNQLQYKACLNSLEKEKAFAIRWKEIQQLCADLGKICK